MPSKVFIIKSSGLGRGDDELGQVLMSSFLRLLGESQEKPAAMIFFNSGVRLVCEESLCLGHLEKLEEQGVEILACSTCLDYFGLEDRQRVGKPTTMAKTIESLLGTEVVSM